MKKKIVLVMFISLLLIGIGGGIFFVWKKNSPVYEEAQSVVVVALLPLSGNAAISGNEIKKGLEMGIANINQHGGIGGHLVDLRIVDTKTNSDNAVDAFLSFENEEKGPLLYITALSGVADAIAPLAQEAQVPVISLLATDNAFLKDNDWMHKYWPSPEDEVEPILELLERKQVRQLTVLVETGTYGEQMKETIEQLAYPELSYSIVHTDGVLLSELDDNILSSESVLILGMSPFLIKYINLLQESSYQGIIITPIAGSLQGLRSEHDFSGIYTVAPLFYNQKFIFSEEFKTRYTLEYQLQATHVAALGYDTLLLLNKISSRPFFTGEINRETVKELLQSTFTYIGILGNFDSFEGNQKFYFPVFITEILSNGELLYNIK